ncbi:hypothetical protein LTR56_000354 [Elasticomyces elasticus]|nr:hypothetical protein LTR56_000354 [Elasticomyces elasticus]KAK3666951.1 hypothetical protein LTR22_002176 [Elasticomyces elasticus]KAK4933346.1 hypothetical protein LTR49_000340 [Elasticomyces elasticus]KAK5743367.1 hypothetical protein LTS12_023889 [Elasticomyces elasticus]
MTAKLAQAVALLDRLAGYTFENDRLLLEAIDTTGMRVPQSNQRLALLGDALLKHVLLDDWYPTGKPKGSGNAIVSSIGSNSNLASVARDCDIEPCIITHPGHRGAVSAATLSTTVEAILGAIYLDSDKSMTEVRGTMRVFGLMPSTAD